MEGICAYRGSVRLYVPHPSVRDTGSAECDKAGVCGRAVRVYDAAETCVAAVKLCVNVATGTAMRTHSRLKKAPCQCVTFPHHIHPYNK